MDKISTAARSANMSQIKSKNTKAEVTVRKKLHGCGLRFRIHNTKLPGKPDIVMPKYKTVIFVNGCFWHQHEGCRRATSPKSNLEYWVPKLKRNSERDTANYKTLSELGWKVKIIWECEINIPRKIEALISEIKET